MKLELGGTTEPFSLFTYRTFLWSYHSSPQYESFELLGAIVLNLCNCFIKTTWKFLNFHLSLFLMKRIPFYLRPT